jgi:hypothetical protein
MNLRSKPMLTALITGAVLAAGGGVIAAGSASAATDAFFARATGSCDTANSQWSIAWHITNQSSETAKITGITATPEGTEVVGYPASVAGGEMVIGSQTVPAPASGAVTITIAGEWADGVANSSVWVFQPSTSCPAS